MGARRFAILARSVAGLPLLLRGGEGARRAGEEVLIGEATGYHWEMV